MDLEDLQQIAATVQVKTSCLVACILRCWMAPDHEVSGAVAAICLQDLSHPLNVWILRILQQIAATVQVKTSCLVACILRCWKAPDHEVSGAVAAICLQDL